MVFVKCVQFDKNVKPTKFSIGQMVLLYAPEKRVATNPKLQHVYFGPFQIQGFPRQGTAHIQDVNSRRTKLVNIRRLKLFVSPATMNHPFVPYPKSTPYGKHYSQKPLLPTRQSPRFHAPNQQGYGDYPHLDMPFDPNSRRTI